MACNSELKYIARIKNEPHHFRIVLTIENFLQYPARVGTAIESPPFQSISEDNLGLQFRLEVYPRGVITEDESGYEGNVGVYLLCEEFPQGIVDVKVYYDVRVLSENGVKLLTRHDKCQSLLFKKNTLFGWNKFIGRMQLEKKAELLPDGHLTLECNIRAYYMLKNPTTTLTIAKTSEEIARVEDIFKEIYQEKICPDVTLKSSNGVLLPAHKCVLAAKSTYFEAIFQSRFRHPTKRNKSLVIVDLSEDMDEQELTALLQYIYWGKAVDNLDIDSASKMFQIADVHGLEGLKQINERALIRQLNDVNALELLNFSQRYGAVNLTKAAALKISNEPHK